MTPKGALYDCARQLLLVNNGSVTAAAVTATSQTQN
jgi:hypothetical protein